MTMHTQPYGSVKPRTQKAHGLMDPGLFPTSPWLRGPGSMRLATKPLGATKVPWAHDQAHKVHELKTFGSRAQLHESTTWAPKPHGPRPTCTPGAGATWCTPQGNHGLRPFEPRPIVHRFQAPKPHAPRASEPSFAN